MNCEEFASAGLGANHDNEFGAARHAEAREHLDSCAHCASLAESWDAARVELQLLADATSADGAPPRVEMRLLQEFRTRHRGAQTRRAAMVATWVLATAAVLVAAVSWVNWRAQQSGKNNVARNDSAIAASENSANVSGTIAEDATLVADNDDPAFTPLPGAIYSASDNATIVRVGMERSSLAAFGLPVNEDRANEWIQVDLLVGDDGLPQAMRIPH